MGDKYRKVAFFCFIGCIACGLIGFGGGYFYSQKHTYVLPGNFLETYTLGLGARADSVGKQLQKEQKKRK